MSSDAEQDGEGRSDENKRTAITFNSDQAFQHLMEHGYVFTFRSDRSEGPAWVRRERGGEKVCDAVVSWAGTTSPHLLREKDFVWWAEWSGFSSADAWADAIVDIHGIGEGGYGQVYLVVREDRVEEEYHE